MTGEVMKEQAGYCKSRWADQCSHSIQTAEDVLNRKFLFDLPWDMEQTTEPVILQIRLTGSICPEAILSLSISLTVTAIGSVWVRPMRLQEMKPMRPALKSSFYPGFPENPITESTKDYLENH